MKYCLDGEYITKDQAVEELLKHPLSTKARWVGDTLWLKTFKLGPEEAYSYKLTVHYNRRS